MTTKEITNNFISRTFIYDCRNHNIISPKKYQGIDINNTKYERYNYSQEDREAIWLTYMYHKMGVSFDQIKELLHGKNMPLRSTFDNLIQKKIAELEELSSIVELMQYVKCIGFMPAPSEEITEQNSTFKEYLLASLEQFHKNTKISQALMLTDLALNTEDINNLSETTMKTVLSTLNEICPNADYQQLADFGLLFKSLKDSTIFDPLSDEVQSIIRQIFDMQNKINNESITPWDFTCNYLFIFSNDSDINALYKKLFGKENMEFCKNAFTGFLMKEEPEKINLLRETLQKNKN